MPVTTVSFETAAPERHTALHDDEAVSGAAAAAASEGTTALILWYPSLLPKDTHRDSKAAAGG
jgi:hypothetical protein